MGLLQTGVSILAALLVGTGTGVLLARGARSRLRIYLLLAFSVLAVYWFQPALPLRSFDFWLPSLSLALVVLTWFAISRPEAWRERQNSNGLVIILGLTALIDLSRYVLPDPLFTATTAPQFLQYFSFIVIFAAISLALAWLSPHSRWVLAGITILLLTILIILKTPGLSLQASIFFRLLSNRSTETATALDLSWLGFSYIAFRLIHVLRDKQLGRLPELALPEFATYVVFFPSLAAGPIDRAERFVQDLRGDFVLTQDKTLLGGQRIAVGLFKKFVIADALALIALNDALATQARTAGWMWIILYAYTFQIYFDFSGYTDIAIGMARLTGIKLPENFAAPYLKPNLAQFWNSWHMTLTQWFRSYFFNPFNRWIRRFKDMPPWGMILIGQVATMALIGLWHGVTLNFILWGLWHGLGLFLQNRWSDFVRARYPNLGQDTRLQSTLRIGGILLTFHFVALGWTFFALSQPALSWQVFRKLFNLP